MIDLHTHILPNTDDGSKSLQESIDIIKEAEKVGIKKICFTPHYFENRFVKKKRDNVVKFNEVKEIAREENIKVELYLGNEIYLNERTLAHLDENILSCIGESRYLLIELPMNQEIKYLDEIFEELAEKDYKVIIAHPERYVYVQKNPDYLLRYIERKIYFQSNYGSIIGIYGSKAKKTIKTLLKRNMINILSSDIHRENTIYNEMDKIIKKTKKIVDEEYFNLITNINPEKILNDEELEILRPKKR